MVRRVSPSQLKNMLRQAENKQKQAFNKYNQEVRRYNGKLKQEVSKYNQEVRAYNSRVRANSQRLKNELAKLNRQSTPARYVVFRASVNTLYNTYKRLDQRAETQTINPSYDLMLDLSEREAANSLEVMNTLLSSGPEAEQPTDDLQAPTLTDKLRNISEDLDDRWQGAVFSLHPRNPDAARHFCTSAREVITQILEIKAPDTDVISLMPNCDRTDEGKPTRRAKIRFFLHHKGMNDDILEEFFEQNLENIVELFQVLNDGTHGSAGKFDFHQLSTIKKRVEDGIIFLSQLVN